jgi:hypothetical protein
VPDIVLDYHRLKTPIDHPDSSVTKSKLSVDIFDMTFSMWAWKSGFDVLHHENPNSDHTYTLMNFATTDYGYIVIAIDGMRMAVRCQYPTWGSLYTHEMITGNSASDHVFVVWVNGSGTRIGTESVDLSAYHYLYALSVSGSSFKAYRRWVTAKNVAAQTPKFTVTNTQWASGYYGLGFVRGTHQFYYPDAYYTKPWSTSTQPLAVVELPVTGSGTTEDLYRPALAQELVEIDPTDPTIPDFLKLEKRKYDALKSRGFTDEEIRLLLGYIPQHQVDRLAVTWGSIDFRVDPATGRPIASTFLVAVYPSAPEYVRRDNVLKQIEHARSKGLRVYTPPFDMSNVREIHAKEKRDRDWLITENELAYQILGFEELEVDAVADFYERELINLGRIKNVRPEILDETLAMWEERAKRLKRDRALEKLRKARRR